MLIWKINKILIFIIIFILSLVLGTRLDLTFLNNLQSTFDVQASNLKVNSKSSLSKTISLNNVLGIQDQILIYNSTNSQENNLSNKFSNYELTTEFKFQDKNSTSQISDKLNKINFSANTILITDKNNVKYFAKNENSKVAIASITKLATILTAMKFERNLNTEFVVPDSVTQLPETKAALLVGEKYKFRDLIAASLIYSANDSASTIASNIETKYKVNFQNEMNSFANSIGMQDTYFKNPTGLDEVGSFSSAEDVLKLAKYAYSNYQIQSLAKLQSYDFSSLSGKSIHIQNTNQMLKFSEVTGLKTGTTLNAGECLVLTIEKNNNTYFVVILGSSDRYKDAEGILKNL